MKREQKPTYAQLEADYAGCRAAYKGAREEVWELKAALRDARRPHPAVSALRQFGRGLCRLGICLGVVSLVLGYLVSVAWALCTSHYRTAVALLSPLVVLLAYLLGDD